MWSSDGKRLLFDGYTNGSYDIWVVDADGGHLRDLTPHRALDYGATWAPDGSRVVFGSNRGSRSQYGGDLYVVSSNGGRAARLTRGGRNYGPEWSPDGRWIAFNSRRDGNSELYLMRPDATGQRRLTHQRKDDAFPRWVGTCR